ncbi:hypothetical protein Q2K19_09020 [Micromonospora soli]|uniref:hypothetical protein n=1 Tax=Micromonospora sp. NBRC 110009 TaxID=3061627 RepID=UPI0026732C4F|nr:hypothetical protein [Micromonospora sp. NBRC 110009]WKU00602.1 hypothetical protein Q2K19_09020 [Micromonospora sp. NBRC 110009]
MNEVKLLETHGPNGPDLSDEALHAARTRLLAEISAAATAVPYSTRSALLSRLGAVRPGRRQLLARLALAGAGLAAVAATAVAVMPEASQQHATRPPVTADGPPRTRPAVPARIKLVAVTAPEFPYALPSLGKPTFTADPGGPIMAVYLAPDGSDVVLTSGTGNEGQPMRGERDISVDGRPGRIISISDVSGAAASVQLTWERRPDEWVMIVGNGRHASVEAVLQLARQVVDQPQRLAFKVAVGLVPDGWKLGGFKDGGSIISYRDPANPDLDLHVQWTPKPDTAPDSRIEGFETARTVTVNKRPARLVQATQFWRLTAPLSDGSGFTLMTPRSFTPDQVLAVANSIRLSRT